MTTTIDIETSKMQKKPSEKGAASKKRDKRGQSVQLDNMKELFKNYQPKIPLPSLRDSFTVKETTTSRQGTGRKQVTSVTKTIRENEYDSLRTYLNDRSSLLKQLRVVEKQKLQLRAIRKSKLIESGEGFNSRRTSPRSQILNAIRAK